MQFPFSILLQWNVLTPCGTNTGTEALKHGAVNLYLRDISGLYPRDL